MNALVDDPGDPGAHFVERVRSLSVGYSLVEPLAAAGDLCDEALAQLHADSTLAELPAADLLAETEAINAALELAAQQIRMDAFYAGQSLPAQFIPDGAAALQNSIAAFYAKASSVLG